MLTPSRLFPLRSKQIHHLHAIPMSLVTSIIRATFGLAIEVGYHLVGMLQQIVKYFIHRITNAYAESLNSKIKQFRAQLRGVVDVDFFLYRLSMIFG